MLHKIIVIVFSVKNYFWLSRKYRSYPCLMRSSYNLHIYIYISYGSGSQRIGVWPGKNGFSLELIGFRLLHGDAKADEALSEPTQREILLN